MEVIMKKLLTLTFTILALLLSSTALQAQNYKKYKHKKRNKNIYSQNNGTYYNTEYRNNGYRKGHYNRRGVYVFYKTKYKWYSGRKYKLTYKIKVFPNGRKKKKLIKVQKVRNHNYYTNYGYGVKTYYRSHTIYQGWKRYRVTYKIKRFPNGRIKRKLVKKVRLRYW